MRRKYYKLIKNKKINDVLSLIEELSYTKKYEILISLLQEFKDIRIINKALDTYKTRYIDLGRVIIYKLKTTLIYFCRNYSQLR